MNHNAREWDALATRYGLAQETLRMLQRFAGLVQQGAQECNLTALHETADVIAYHFADSLELTRMIDLSKPLRVVDVGTGAGFPGMVLAIVCPHVQVTLLEVREKRVRFLMGVVQDLGLSNVVVYAEDWRTWLRSKRAVGDVVCARASLQPEELLRMLRPSSPLRSSVLVYWASAEWQPANEAEANLIQAVHPYIVGDRHRKLIRFAAQSADNR